VDPEGFIADQCRVEESLGCAEASRAERDLLAIGQVVQRLFTVRLVQLRLLLILWEVARRLLQSRLKGTSAVVSERRA
jgi:hypothetical protein